MQPVIATEIEPGILDNGGTATTRLFVFTGRVPQEAPKQWADVLEAERHADGSVADWHLVGAVDPSTRQQLRDWRAKFVTERLIGDVATIRGFLAWADKHCDVAALHGLRLAEAHFSPHTVMRVGRQAAEAASTCQQRADVGLGLFGGQRNGLIRGFATCDGPVTVLADKRARVVATADALEVTDPVAGAVQVSGWRTDEDGTVVTTPDGELSLGTGPAAQLLAKAAPGYDEVRVGPVPLSRVFAELFGYLPEMAREAANSHTELLAHTTATPWR